MAREPRERVQTLAEVTRALLEVTGAELTESTPVPSIFNEPEDSNPIQPHLFFQKYFPAQAAQRELSATDIQTLLDMNNGNISSKTSQAETESPFFGPHTFTSFMQPKEGILRPRPLYTPDRAKSSKASDEAARWTASIIRKRRPPKIATSAVVGPTEDGQVRHVLKRKLENSEEAIATGFC